MIEDVLQVSVRPLLPQTKPPHRFPSQALVSSKSSKAEGYKTFRDEVVNTLKAHPELVADERLGRAIARVSRVSAS